MIEINILNLVLAVFWSVVGYGFIGYMILVRAGVIK